MLKNPSISIVIPVKNGITTIRQCLNAIYSQTIIDQTEVIVIDSGSSDGTLEALKEYPVRLYQIAAKDFNHGETRNYGVSLAKGEFVLMTVQDAVVMENNSLEKLRKHFFDIEADAVYGHQIVPHQLDKNPHQWFRPISEPKLQIRHFKQPNDFLNLSQVQKYNLSQWDNVFAIYRKTIFQKTPFRKTSFAEDIQWAHDALLNGHKLIFDPSIRIGHYHHTNFKDSFKRTYTVLHQMNQLFGVIPKNKYNPKIVPYIIYRNFKYKAEFKWIFYNLNIVISNSLATSTYKILQRFGKAVLNSSHNHFCKNTPIGKANKTYGKSTG